MKPEYLQTTILLMDESAGIATENLNKRLLATTDGAGEFFCLKQPAAKTIKANSPKATLRYFVGSLLGRLVIILIDFTSL